MRRILVISFILIAVISANCGGGKSKNSTDSSASAISSGKSEMVFREYQHDFGKIAEGEKISYTFTFENKGNSNLIISSATTTCGCTVTKYDKKPIPPGASGILEVAFDTSGRSGMQTKIITVRSNATTPVALLKITAEVVTADK
jgi:hypothetical protein